MEKLKLFVITPGELCRITQVFTRDRVEAERFCYHCGRSRCRAAEHQSSALPYPPAPAPTTAHAAACNRREALFLAAATNSAGSYGAGYIALVLCSLLRYSAVQWPECVHTVPATPHVFLSLHNLGGLHAVAGPCVLMTLFTTEHGALCARGNSPRASYASITTEHGLTAVLYILRGERHTVCVQALPAVEAPVSPSRSSTKEHASVT